MLKLVKYTYKTIVLNSANDAHWDNELQSSACYSNTHLKIQLKHYKTINIAFILDPELSFKWKLNM